jgi:hypothetical protein
VVVWYRVLTGPRPRFIYLLQAPCDVQSPAPAPPVPRTVIYKRSAVPSQQYPGTTRLDKTDKTANSTSRSYFAQFMAQRPLLVGGFRDM